MRNITARAGFSLIEALLAVSILALLASVFTGAIIFGQESMSVSLQRIRAAFLAEEVIEAVRNMRDEHFGNLTPGAHGMAQLGNQWIFSGTNDALEIFNREVLIADLALNTKLITSTVSYQETQTRTATLALTTHLTDWRKGVGGMLAYADFSGNDDVIRYKLLDRDGLWSGEFTVPSAGVPLNRDVRYVKLYASPSRNEKILITKHAETGAGNDQYLYAHVWNGTAWGNQLLLASWSGMIRPSVRDFDADYLANGNFLLVYEDNTSTPKTRTWNGASWSAQSATQNVGGNPDWIVLRARSGTNEAMMAVRDAAGDTNTAYWNGTSWGSLVEHATDSSGLDYENISFAWSGAVPTVGALVFNESADNFPNIRIWNGVSWGANVENQSVGAVTRIMQVTARPDALEFIACVKDATNDINCLESNATPFWVTLSGGEVGTNTDPGFQRSFAVAYESQLGSAAIVVYSHGATAGAQAIPKYRSFNPATNAWTSENSLPQINAVLETVELVPSPDANDIMVLMANSSQDLSSIVWNGAEHNFFSVGGLTELTHGTEGSFDEDVWFHFAWDDF